MKSNRAIFIIVLQAIVLLVGACSKKSDKPSANNSRQPSSANTSQVSRSQSTQKGSSVHFKEDKVETHAERTGQVLQDISEAKVSERTKDLKQTFGKLDDICAKAVGTCTDLLAANFVTDQDRELLTRKEAQK